MPYSVLALSDDADAVAAALPDSRFRVIPFDIEPGATAVTAPGALFPLIGGVASQTAHADALATAIKGHPWILKGTDTPVYDLSTGGAEGAEAWASETLIALSTKALTQLAGVERELARLRIDHQGLLERFATLDSRQILLRPPRLIRTAEIAPRAGLIVVPQHPAALTQLLPVSPLGLAELELHVADLDDDATGDLVVQIEILHTDIVKEVRLPLDEINKGWVGLALDEALTEDHMRAVLHVSHTSEDADALKLSMGMAQPLPEASVRSAGGARVGAPLALRAWRGVPGTARPPRARVHKAEKTTTVSGSLAWPVLSSLAAKGVLPPNAPDTPVFSDEHAGMMVIQAVDNHLVVAAADGIAGPPKERIRATFHAPRPESQPLEVAIGLAPGGVADEELFEYLGPFQTLNSLDYVDAVWPAVDVPKAEDYRLVAAVRLQDKVGMAWAWAGLLRVDFE